MLVHRAVWIAFNGPIPSGKEINHKNGVKSDNRLENLELCTRKENLHHHFKSGRAITSMGKPRLPDEAVVAIRFFGCTDSQEVLARVFGVTRDHIYNIYTKRKRII